MKEEHRNTEDFEERLTSRLVKEFLREQRAQRRWNIFFKLLLAVYVFSFLWIYILNQSSSANFTKVQHTALIDVTGPIMADADASADNVVSSLRKAFKNQNTQGVILRINSPGGSPVQAAYINDEIRRLKAQYQHIPVYAVISDVCASGAYYIAVAADEIYADKASVIGSIGVVMSGFGFVDAIEKLGIERRLLSAGENKGFLDPFMPINPTEQQHVQDILNQIHQQFIDVVKENRGERLSLDDEETLFSGLIWTGEQSLKLGLIDGLASAGKIARDIIKAEEIIDYTKRRNYLDEVFSQLSTRLWYRLQEQSPVLH